LALRILVELPASMTLSAGRHLSKHEAQEKKNWRGKSKRPDIIRHAKRIQRESNVDNDFKSIIAASFEKTESMSDLET
jgi:hypothetical protein